jgi:hypothetical protein
VRPSTQRTRFRDLDFSHLVCFLIRSEIQSDEDGEPDSDCDGEDSRSETVRGGDAELLAREAASTGIGHEDKNRETDGGPSSAAGRGDP